jgi:hypothetical protein
VEPVEVRVRQRGEARLAGRLDRHVLPALQHDAAARIDAVLQR